MFLLINLLFHTDLWLEIFRLSWRSSNKIALFIIGNITPALSFGGPCCSVGIAAKGGVCRLHLLLTFVSFIPVEARINGEKWLLFWKHLVKIPQLKRGVQMLCLKNLIFKIKIDYTFIINPGLLRHLKTLSSHIIIALNMPFYTPFSR